MKIFRNSTFLTSICLLFILGACSDGVPGQYPDREKMTDILVDVHIAEAMLSNQQNIRMSSGENQNNTIYKSVLQKYGITKMEFDSALVWYAAHPKIYMKLYNDVIAKLSDMEAQAQSDLSKQEEKNKAMVEKMTIKSLWKDSTKISYPYADSVDTKFPFDIATDSIKLGQLKFMATYKCQKEDLTYNLQMWLITCYADKSADTIKTEIIKSLPGSSTSVTTNLKPDKQLVQIKGYLLHHKDTEKPKVSIESIQLEHIPSQNPKDYQK